MKKSISNKSSSNNINLNKENYLYDKKKTTNINILLNRVKLDKRKDFKKKIIFLTILISTMSALAIIVVV